MKKESKKVVAYTRVARRESGSPDNCIEMQQQALKDFAANNGYLITEHFYDVGVTKPVEREGYQDMIKAIEESKSEIKYALITQYDRISRNYSLFMEAVTSLKANYQVTIVIAASSPLPEFFLSYLKTTNPI